MVKKTNPPILVVPFKTGDYPRVEVFVEPTGATMGIREEPIDGVGKPLRMVRYISSTPSSIIKQLDDMILTAKMIKGRKNAYDASFESFIELVREHHEFMKSLIPKLELK